MMMFQERTGKNKIANDAWQRALKSLVKSDWFIALLRLCWCTTTLCWCIYQDFLSFEKGFESGLRLGLEWGFYLSNPGPIKRRGRPPVLSCPDPTRRKGEGKGLLLSPIPSPLDLNYGVFTTLIFLFWCSMLISPETVSQKVSLLPKLREFSDAALHAACKPPYVLYIWCGFSKIYIGIGGRVGPLLSPLLPAQNTPCVLAILKSYIFEN